MNPLVRRLAHEATAPLEEMLARLIRTGALIALAAGCAVVAAVFLTIDLFLFLQEIYGSLIAASTVGGCYLLLASILFWLAMRRPSEPAAVLPSDAPAPVMAASLGAKAAPKPAGNPEMAAHIDAAVVPVLKVLRDAGLEKEVLAIEAGAEIAKQLNPFALVAFALGAGLFVGRTLRAKRTPF